MIIILLQLFSICAASWTFWTTIRWLMVKSPLDNIPGPPSQSFWKGNLGQLFDDDGWAFHDRLAETYGSVAKINGICGDKQLFVFDPEAMYRIIVKDQYTYEQTSGFVAGTRAIFGPGVVSSLGSNHRKQRKMLNPVFSSNHIRYMLPTFYRVTNKLRDAVATQVANGMGEIDMVHWMTRTALELIGQSGLGYSFDPLIEDTVDPYAGAIKKMGSKLQPFRILREFSPYIVSIGSPEFRQFVIGLSPWKRLHEVRDAINMLHKMSQEVIDAKKSALRESDDTVLEQGEDLMSILLRANMEASEEDRLSEAEVLAQMSTFIFAAVDTASSALARVLHLLAEHPTKQETLRKEIINARQSGGDLSHDELVALPYLDAVCRETLRLYPPVSLMIRTARKDVVLHFSKPIRCVDGNLVSEIPIPNNTSVVVSILASNRNPALWGEDVLEWKPERWLSSLPDAVATAHVPGVYSNLMSFSGGGRSCIGFKFALLEMKVVMSMLMESFSFSPSDKPITWHMGGVVWPGVEGSAVRKPQLPLRVSKLM